MNIAFNRRRFLAGGVAAMSSTMVLPTFIPRTALAQGARPGANDRITLGVIGCGGRAKLLMDQLPEVAQQVALADCNIEQAFAFRKERKATWDIYGAHYPLLERQDIDAILMTGQEYQRAFPCIQAVQAGKDVYAEKPLTLYIQEGRTMVEHVRKHQAIFQVGTQQRSMEMNRVACEFVRSGGLGKIVKVLAVNYPGIGVTPALDVDGPGSIPSGFNWDLHLNQSAWRPCIENAIAGRNYFGGEMTNWGAHGVDQIQWALGKDDTLPTEFKLVTPGQDGQVIATYADGTQVSFELPTTGPMGGAIFVGEKGKLEINRNKFTSNPPEIRAELIKKVDEAAEEVKWSDQTALWQAKWHLQNWLECIKSRAKPNAEIEIGHRSIAFCHLVNITRYVGKVNEVLHFDPVTERFTNCPEANAWNDRRRRAGYELPKV
jgi:predicted dehydrogenase